MPSGTPTLIVPASTSRSARPRQRADRDGALLDGHAQALFCPVHRDIPAAVADHCGAEGLAGLDRQAATCVGDAGAFGGRDVGDVGRIGRPYHDGGVSALGRVDANASLGARDDGGDRPRCVKDIP
jgi:hypothetical protein